jgi:hypothetical protein
MAGHACIFYHRVVWTRSALNIASTGYAEHHRCFRTVVRPPVGAGDFDHAIDYFTDHSTRLVTIRAQIAQSAVEGHALKGKEIYRVRGLKSKIGIGVGCMDLMTGTAILAGWVWIPRLNLIWRESCSNALAEGSA